MNAKWIVEDFSSDGSHKDLIAEVRKQGLDCVTLDITNQFKLDWDKIGFSPQCLVFNGSIQLANKLMEEDSIGYAHSTGRYPIVWNTYENYNCTKYYPVLGKHLFNDQYSLIQVAEFKRMKWMFYKMFSKETTVFIRPDGGEKSFTGRLLDLQDFDKFWKDGVHQNAKDTDIMVVSSPKTIRGEWRFVVSPRCTEKIIACSTYQYQGQRTLIPSAPIGATRKCLDVMEEGYHPDPVYTIDICEDADGTFWLLELNSFHSAGMYAADKAAIVREVSRIAVEDWEARYKSNKEI